MARQLNRLKGLDVERKRAPGYYPDGNGLYLQISDSTTKSWIYRYALAGRTREMGLGSFPEVSLAKARAKAAEARSLKAEGFDPIDERRAKKAAEAADRARQITFEDAAKKYIQTHKAGWRNAKHGNQWENTLKMYAYPSVGTLPVQDINTAKVLKVLEPIWTTKTETATRVRQRLEAILDWAKTREHRSGDNPARWKGHLENLLPKPGKIQKVKHHPALPYPDLPDFMQDLSQEGGVAPKGLQFMVLTAARTSEVTGAKWSEFDVGKKIWTVPKSRIKAGKEHRVPLSDPCVALLEEMRRFSTGDYVFPGGKRDQPLSNAAFLALLDRMNRSDITAHGFRSTFRDWAAEQTTFPREIAEVALGHVNDDETEAAYLRTDFFDKRRKLMEEWANFAAMSSSRKANV